MSTIAIAGGHGKIAMILGRALAERGDTVRGLIRNPDQSDDLRAAGIDPVVCDLEGDGDVAGAIRGADAVGFAAKAEGVSGYLIASWRGAEKAPAEGAEGFGAYLRAKFEADEAVRASGLDYTVVRPGGLTEDPGTGLVTIAEKTDRGQTPRADVAAVLLACLDRPSTIGKSFDVISGTTPIA